MRRADNLPPRRQSWPGTTMQSGALVLLTAALLTAATSPASASTVMARGATADDAFSSATSTAVHPIASQAVVVSGILPADGRGAVAGARAQSPCIHCSAEATTLQVLSAVGDSAIRADNTASAFTTGDWATTSAVSVQVITGTRARSITASNAAVAINQGCTGCRATSVAIQFVVIGGTQRQLRPETRAVLAQMEHELAARLETAPQPPTARAAVVRSAAADAARQGEEAVLSDSHGAVRTHLDIDLGG